MEVYCYSKCSTCRKALKYLNERQISYQVKDLKEMAPDKDSLRQWYQKSGLPLKRFFNTSGQIYKELGLKDKLASMSEEEQLSLLSQNGMLVKRPLVISSECILVGFKEGEWDEKIQ